MTKHPSLSHPLASGCPWEIRWAGQRTTRTVWPGRAQQAARVGQHGTAGGVDDHIGPARGLASRQADHLIADGQAGDNARHLMGRDEHAMFTGQRIPRPRLPE
jgi:hypothetical protein